MFVFEDVDKHAAPNYLEAMSCDHKKKAPFTAQEKRLLTQLLAKNSRIVESKKSDGATRKRKKEAWHVITKQFNESDVSMNFVSAQQLKKFWLNTKAKQARREGPTEHTLECDAQASANSEEDERQQRVESPSESANPKRIKTQRSLPDMEAAKMCIIEQDFEHRKIMFEEDIRFKNIKYEEELSHLRRKQDADYEHQKTMIRLFEEEQRLKIKILEKEYNKN